MNDELKSKLLEILTAAQKAGGDAYDYVKREAPELAREVVLWNVVECAMWLAAGLVLLGVAAWLGHTIKTQWAKWTKWDDFDPQAAIYPVLLSFCLIAGSVTVAINTTYLLKAHYAPRVFFLMSCKELLK